MWTWFLLVINNCIMVVVIRCAGRGGGGGAGASHNACLHTDSLSLMCDYIFNCVWNVILFSVLSVLQGCIFILPFYYTTLILSCCEIF